MSDTPYTPAPTLQRIRELQAQGDSLRKIAVKLQTEGVPLPGRRQTWTHTAVHTCLNQPASAPSAPASPTLVAELVQALEPKFDAVLARTDQRVAWVVPPIEAGWLGWSRKQWAAGGHCALWSANATIGVVLLALRWVQ